MLSNDANLEVRDSVSDLFVFSFFLSFFLSFDYIVGQNQRTPLHRACRNGPEDVVSLLLSHNADLEPRDSVSDFFVFSFLFFPYFHGLTEWENPPAYCM